MNQLEILKEFEKVDFENYFVCEVISSKFGELSKKYFKNFNYCKEVIESFSERKFYNICEKTYSYKDSQLCWTYSIVPIMTIFEFFEYVKSDKCHKNYTTGHIFHKQIVCEYLESINIFVDLNSKKENYNICEIIASDNYLYELFYKVFIHHLKNKNQKIITNCVYN